MNNWPPQSYVLRPKLSVFLFLGALMASCNGNQTGSALVIPNVMPLRVFDGFGTGTTNVLYTTVTICDLQSNCQNIDKIQVDTGSVGLRIFQQALANNLSLPSVMNGQSPVGECESFALTSAWGPVRTASVGLGGEPKITMSIHVIDSTFSQPAPFPCDSGLMTTPMDSRVNGILGIGVAKPMALDFSCQGGTCTPFTLPTSQSVVNPVLLLPVDNNGVIINLPGIPDNGQATVEGDLVLGINTQDFNNPAKYSAGPVVAVSLNPTDPLSTSASTDGQSFFQFAFDTGSNAYFFSDANIPNCPPSLGSIISGSSLFCPPMPKNLPVLITGTGGTTLGFQLWIRDATALQSTGNLALNDVAGNLGGVTDLFIAGLPFFYGKQVYFGYAGGTNLGGTSATSPQYGYALR